jgi:hypothetical protein
LIVVFPPTAIAVAAVVFVALLLPSGNGDGKNTHHGKDNKMAGNKEGDGKGQGQGRQERDGKSGKSMGMATKKVMSRATRSMPMAMNEAMATAAREGDGGKRDGNGD